MDRPALLYVTRRLPDHDAALDHALRLCQATGASLSIIHAPRGKKLPPTPGLPESLRRIMATLTQAGVDSDVHILGDRWQEDLERMALGSYDLILKVPEPESAMRRRLGTTLDQRLARAPGVPVWFVPASRGAQIRVVLAAVELLHEDHSLLDAAAVRTAATVAEAAAASLHVVHAWAPTLRGMGTPTTRRWRRSMKASRRQRLREVLSLAGSRVEAHPILIGEVPAAGIRKAAHRVGADLLVMGTVRRDGWEGLLAGNLAEHFVGMDGMGALIVKADGLIPNFLLEKVAA